MKKILGIETSCDDTCISLIEAEKENPFYFKVLSNIVSSQTEIHKKWGGIHPTLAKREHQENLTPLLGKTLSVLGSAKVLPKKKLKCSDSFLEKESRLSKKLLPFLEKTAKPPVDAVAVTVGPGLDPSLWTGVNFAKTISCYWKIPIIPVNHIEAHLIISLFSLEKGRLIPRIITFPAIGLIVSGGHTQLVLIKKIGRYELIGETRDDAAGECFDKTARILGLGYPGGPAISEQARKESSVSVDLPRPMIHAKNYDFSFSGLKTAVLYLCKSLPREKRVSGQYCSAIAREIEQAIIDVLFKKTLRAVKEYGVETLILGGGVVASQELQKKFKKTGDDVAVLFPPGKTQTDNALMTAVTGFFKNPLPLKKVKAAPNLRL